MNNYVNVYLDINAQTKKPFYVGIGDIFRCLNLNRNRFHREIVNNLPNRYFIRKIIYKNIDLDKAYKIEIQIIKKCGRICNGSGYLANIHPGGPLEMNIKNNIKPHWLKGKSWKDIFGQEAGREIIKKQIESRSKNVIERHRLYGLSEKEKQRYEKMKQYHAQGHFKESYIKKSERCQAGNYTQVELDSFKRCSERQEGKSMIERLNNPNYVDPRRGKSMSKILNNPDYKPWNYGKNMKELKGSDYICHNSHPFKLLLNGIEIGIFTSEKDTYEKLNFNSVTLQKLKKAKQHIIKRLKNSKHNFKTGDILTFEWCNN